MKRSDDGWLAKLLEVPRDLAPYFRAQRRDRRSARWRPSAQSRLEMAKDTYLQRRLEYLKRRLYPKSVPDWSRELRSIDEQTNSEGPNLQRRPPTILQYNSVDKNYRK
jgi:hypothetical protein